MFVFVDSIQYKKRTCLTFILSKHDIITPMTSNNDYDFIDIHVMTFCNCNVNVTVTRLICIFITHVKYYIYCMTVLHGKWPMLYNKGPSI